MGIILPSNYRQYKTIGGNGMKRRKKKMCKYANTGVVKVTSQKQLQTIKEALSTRSDEKKRVVQQPRFDSKLWTSKDKK